MMAGCVAWTRPRGAMSQPRRRAGSGEPAQTWRSAPLFSDNQQGYTQFVPHWINCIPEYQIFQAAMAVGAHNNEVGLDLQGIAHDLATGRGACTMAVSTSIPPARRDSAMRSRYCSPASTSAVDDNGP